VEDVKAHMIGVHSSGQRCARRQQEAAGDANDGGHCGGCGNTFGLLP
jgi:hypothetical protein